MHHGRFGLGTRVIFRVEDIKQFPRGVWLLDVRAGDCLLLKGVNVEAYCDWFAEGAWAGSRDKVGFVTSSFRCGSGAVVGGQAVTVLAPSHTLEAIYYFAFQDEDRWFVSNSFPCILGARPVALMWDFVDLTKRGRTMRQGLSVYERVLLQDPAGTIYRVAFAACRITPSSKAPIELLPAFPAAPFNTYREYVNYLTATVVALVENARASTRKASFDKCVTSCSSGYDSPTGAVIARNAGCRDAVTLSTSRGGGSDSGREVAEALGLRCHEFPRFATSLEYRGPRDYHVGESEVDAQMMQDLEDFLISIVTPEDAVFAPFTPLLEDAIFFSGFHGGQIWITGGDTGPYIIRGDNSGSGLDAFRQRLGFVHVPVPFIGCRHAAKVKAIAAGNDMAPYRLGNNYDRPIARRICEEAGVPREAFGQIKSRGSVLFKDCHAKFSALLASVAARYRHALSDR